MTVGKLLIPVLSGQNRDYPTVKIQKYQDFYRLKLGPGFLYTPLSLIFEAQSFALMKAIAAEWEAIEPKEKVDLTGMPLTKLLCTLIDRVKGDQSSIINYLVSTIDNDLLCYRAPRPVSLVETQNLLWDPIINWLKAEHGVLVSVSQGIIPITQSFDTKENIQSLLEGMDVQTLTALQALVSLTGSLCLSLIFVCGKINISSFIEAFYLDDDWQMRRWGKDLAAEQEKALFSDIVSHIHSFMVLR